MGPIIRDVRSKNKQRCNAKGFAVDADEKIAPTIKWPQVGSYKEDGVTVRVMKKAWLEGAHTDHVVKPRRKKKK